MTEPHMQHVFEQYDRTGQPVPGPYRFCPICRTELVFDATIQRQVCPACAFIHFRNPSPTVTVCVVRDGSVLLTKRAFPPGEGLWAIPGGYIEYEEDFLSAGVREIKEETGFEVQIKAIVNVVSSFLSSRWHYVNICLLASVVAGELTGCDEFEAICWHPLAGQLPEMAFLEDVENLRLLNTSGFRGLPVVS